MPADSRLNAALDRPMGRSAVVALGFAICVAPAWLFFDPLASYHRDPIRLYRLRHDDFLYVARARSWARTIEYLFIPHVTHFVPAFRILTRCLVAVAGRMSRVPQVLAWASYAILVAVMILTGRLVARETNRPGLGFAAMAAVGTTSVMTTVAMWYSAGQALWAGFGVLTTLWYLQGWRRSGGGVRLVLAALAAMLSGWFWTIGHFAGPVGAIYLWFDGRSRCRKAALVPLVATALSVALGTALAAHKIESKLSFHGRTTREAVNPVQGVLHTGQAITEDLLLGNLGLSGISTPAQGAVITVAVFLSWLWSRRHGWRFNSLEAAGAAFLAGSYLVEWTVRGYLPFSSLRGILPWYDANPQIGAVLFAAGWWSGPSARKPEHALRTMTWRAGLHVILFTIGLVVINRARVDAQCREMVPPLTPWEAEHNPGTRQQNQRTTDLAAMRAAWQRRHLAKLERAEAIANESGIGRDAIARVFGRLNAPDLPSQYDAIDLLDVAPHGRESDPDRIRAALGAYVTMEPDPRPPGLPEAEPWPISPQ
jgi:hypothetical protein